VDVFFSAYQKHHPQVDADKAPKLPGKKCTHEERETGWLCRVHICVDFAWGFPTQSVL
jgi:hypothetical protein